MDHKRCTLLVFHCRAIVNICFAYTSTQELQHAADEIAAGLAESHLLQHDVRPSLLQRVMHTKVGPQRMNHPLPTLLPPSITHTPCMWGCLNTSYNHRDALTASQTRRVACN